MKITAIMFTYSTDHYYIRTDETVMADCLTGRQLQRLVGNAEFDRLRRIAFQMTGHWHAVS